VLVFIIINIRYLFDNFLENSIPFSYKILLTYYVRTFTSPHRPDRLWGPSNLLFNGYWGLFPRRVELSEREADHSTPPSAEVKKIWIYTSTPSHVFMAQCLVTHRDNFCFYLYYVRMKASFPLKITNKISCPEDGCSMNLRNFSAKIHGITSQKITIIFSYIHQIFSRLQNVQLCLLLLASKVGCYRTIHFNHTIL
jgi:hypothetical protein